MSEANKTTKKELLHEIISWVVVIGVAVLIGTGINTFVLFKAWVPSGSMENTLKENDELFGFRLAYLFSEPERGDIIIFEPEQVNIENSNYPEDEEIFFVKRIIGLPGETVEIIDGKVYIWEDETGENKRLLEEPYLKETPKKESYGPYEVPEGCYFMLGDNRNNSYDSVEWPDKYVKKEKIRSKAWLRYKPDFGIIK